MWAWCCTVYRVSVCGKTSENHERASSRFQELSSRFQRTVT